MEATGGFDGVPSCLIAEGWGARVPLLAYPWLAKLSDEADTGWIGRGSEPHGAWRAVTGVLKSPVEMLEKGRFLLGSSAATWLWLRGRSEAKSLSISSCVRLPSDSSLFSMLWIRSASSLIYLQYGQ